jgi:DNA polymerase-1
MRDVEVVVNDAQLAEALTYCDNAGTAAFDTEGVYPDVEEFDTFNVFDGKTIGYSLAAGDRAWYIPLEHGGVFFREKVVLPWKCNVVCHNLKHEITAAGLEQGKGPVWGVEDTMLLAFLLGRPKIGLKELTGRTDSFDVIKAGRSLDQVPLMELARYAAEDARGCLQLFEEYKQSWAYTSEAYRLDLDVTWVIAAMERRGMHLSDGAAVLAQKLQGEMRALEDEWEFLFPGVDIGSPSQLRQYFYGSGLWTTEGVELTDKKKEPKVDHAALQCQLAFPENHLGRIAAEIKLSWQDRAKIVSTYTNTLLGAQARYSDGRLHPSYSITRTATGRFACSRPNLQNIPVRSELGREVKRLFVPARDAVFVSADYSQIELRMLAHLAPNGKLAEAYRKGADVHQQTADLVGVTRDMGKTGNFAVVYGAGGKKLAKAFHSSEEEAMDFVRGYAEAYPEVKELRDRVVKAATARGYVKTLTGRRRYLPDLQSGNKYRRWAAERRAFNTPIQGGAADIVKMGMVAAHKAGLPIVGQVHDEVLLESPEGKAEQHCGTLKRCLEDAYDLKVPLVAEPKIGRNWGECK